MIVLSALAGSIILFTFVTLCFVMIVARVAISWKIHKRWTAEDSWMLGALCFLVGLWYSGHQIHHGTNNVQNPELLTPEELKNRIERSKLAIIGRFCYASSIWCMKFCILAVYTKIVDQFPEYKRFIKYIWACLFLTWAGSIAITLLECRPFNHYWQVYPVPSAACKTARGQIYGVGISNMVTDLILIIYPMPIIFRTRLPLKQKLEACTLFSLGFFIIAVSAMRLALVVRHGSLQQWRTTFGSLELFAASCVTNGPTFYRLIVNKIRTGNIKGIIKDIPTGGSSGRRRTADYPSGQARRAIVDEDLEMAERDDPPVEVRLASKQGSAADTGARRAEEHRSQEFLKVH